MALIVAVVVVAAIVVSVFTFLRSTEGTSPDGTPVRVGAESPGGGEEGSPPAGEGPDAQASGTEGAAAAVGDTVAPVDSDRIESLGESLLESISRYYGLAVALDQGRAECSALQEAYVEVENRWMAYNVEGKARFRGRLPDDLAARDERLYEGVQDVEQEFGRSGCERP